MLMNVSTHSRPKAAGRITAAGRHLHVPFQLTAARRRLVFTSVWWVRRGLFQLTAARRRLAYQGDRMDIDGWFQLTAARRRLVWHTRMCQ